MLFDKILTNDAVVTEPPSAPNCSCISGPWKHRVGKEEMDMRDVTDFPCHLKRVLKPGGCVFSLQTFLWLMNELWHSDSPALMLCRIATYL